MAQISSYNYIGLLQAYVCLALNEMEFFQDLSVSWYPENSKDIEYEIKNALQKQGLACIAMTPNAVYRGHDGAGCAYDCELTMQICEFPPINRASNKISCTTGLDIANLVGDALGGPHSICTFGRFCPKRIEQSEESGLLVTKVIFDTTYLGTIGEYDWDEEDHHIIITPYALQEDLDELSANVLNLSAVVADLSGHSELSNYYTKSETSSAVELSSAFSGKADKTLLADYLPLSGGNISGDVNISMGDLSLKDGTGYVTKFDVAHRTGGDMSIVQYYESTPETPYTVLNVPTGTTGKLALVSDIDSAVSSKANLSALDNYLPLSGGNITGHLSIENEGGNSNFTLRNALDDANVDIYPVWDSPDVGNTLYVAIDNGLGNKNYFSFPNKSGVVAVKSDIDAAVSSKADLTALTSKADISSLNNYLPLSGGLMTGDISAVDVTDYKTVFDIRNHTGGDFYIKQYDANGNLYSNIQVPNKLNDKFALTSEIDSAVSAKADLTALNNYLPLAGGHLSGNLSIDTTYFSGLTLVNTTDNAKVTFSQVWESPDRGSVLQVESEDGMGTTYWQTFPSKNGTLAVVGESYLTSETSSSVELSNEFSKYLPLSGGAVILNDSPEGTTLIVQSNNPNGYSWLETKLTSDAGLAMYADIATRAIYIDRNYEQRFQNKNGVIALTSDINTAVSSKADKSALSNYVPLSGNATISGDIAIDADKFSVTTPSCCLSVDGKNLVMWQTNLSSGQIDNSVISCAGEVYGRIGHFRGLGGLELLQIQTAPYEEGQSETADVLQCQTPWGSDAFTVKVEYDPANFERILPRLKSYDGAYFHGFTLSSETMEMDLNTAEGSGKLKFPAKTGTLATTSDISASLSAYQKHFYGESSTASSTLTKAVTISGFTAADFTTGTKVAVKFTNNLTYNGLPKLNINSLSAIPIQRVAGTAAARYEWMAGEVVTFVYDAGQAAWVEENGGVATTTYYGYTKLTTSATSTSTATSLTPASLNSFSLNSVFPYAIYSSTSAYSVGDKVRYSYNAYVCNTAISEDGEAWNADHWTKIDPIQTLIDNINSAIGDVETILNNM